jgi:hypothetical protein
MEILLVGAAKQPVTWSKTPEEADLFRGLEKIFRCSLVA